MSWILMGQIAALIALYIGGIFSVAHIVGKRVDDLNRNMSNRFDADFGKHIDQRFEHFGKHIDQRFEHIDQRFEHIDQRFEHIDQRFENIDRRFNDLRAQMSREHDALAQKVDVIDRKLDAHISNYEIHRVTESE